MAMELKNSFRAHLAAHVFCNDVLYFIAKVTAKIKKKSNLFEDKNY